VLGFAAMQRCRLTTHSALESLSGRAYSACPYLAQPSRQYEQPASSKGTQ
jgi:hypothetical protein